MYSFFDTFNLRAQISMGTAPEDDYLVHFDPQDVYKRQALQKISWPLRRSKEPTVANMPMTVFDMISAMQNKYADRVAFRYVEGKDTVCLLYTSCSFVTLYKNKLCASKPFTSNRGGIM